MKSSLMHNTLRHLNGSYYALILKSAYSRIPLDLSLIIFNVYLMINQIYFR